jgi:hypothetical protein
MEPLSIIGATGAVANIVDALAKTISTVADLRSRWKDAELAVVAFETQLVALRAALTKIHEWTTQEFASPHHQLVMDLDRCMMHCRQLIAGIDAELAGLRNRETGQLDAAGKARLLYRTKGISDMQKMVKNLTSALTLLLTACSW